MRQFALPAFAAVALAACGAAPPASADSIAAPRTLVVSGTGEASAAPDMAIISIGVQTEAKTAAAALAANAAQMNTTMAKLKSLGVAEKDIQTRNISVGPQYDYENNRRSPRIIGYTASNTVTVKVRKLDKTGAIIDETVSTGANTLGGLHFTFADAEPLRNDARREAVRNARDKALLYADAAGVKLGPILQIQDGTAQTPMPRPMMQMRVESVKADSTPVAAGESTLTSTVTLIYEIR